MVVKWRERKIGDKYLDWEWLLEHMPKSFPRDSSHGYCSRHPNTAFRYNPTVPVRTSLAVLTGLVNQLQNRWEFNVHKVDEWVEISPSHPYYQSIIKQKREMIREIKEGLAHVDRAISDVELLFHDKRRYKEILSYFSEKDEHSLKAMFIDMVDVNLPEGVSLRSIAPRWPTIIADFQELSDEDDTTEKIRKKIEVSKAEAVVLTTKVRMYKKWKEFFGKEVKDRYRRIIERLEGRKASIEEYRNWIRPLIRRVMQTREVDDSTLAMHMNIPIGTGMPVSFQYAEWWAWTRMEGLEPTEPHKIPKIRHEAKDTGKRYIGTLELKVREGAVPRFRIEPYDDVVKKFIPEIEKKHGVKITKEDVLEARIRLYEKGSPDVEWYVLVHFPVTIETFKLPSGLEVEDVDFNKISAIFITQNMLLVKIIEIIAEEKKIDVYIDELLGKKVMTEDGIVKQIDDLLREEFPNIYGPKEEEGPKGLSKSISEFKSSFRKALASLIRGINYFFGFKIMLIKGPYDPIYEDRLLYEYGRPFFREIFNNKIWAYLQKNFGGVG
jgi:hypothetical protein